MRSSKADLSGSGSDARSDTLYQPPSPPYVCMQYAYKYGVFKSEKRMILEFVTENSNYSTNKMAPALHCRGEISHIVPKRGKLQMNWCTFYFAVLDAAVGAGRPAG
jgi:hypothetical protein